MGRTREFDPDAVLDKAMELFWEKGYAETSVRDLVKHTGVAHAGLYSAFGDKQALFKKAMERYADRVIEEQLELLEGPGAAKPAIHAYFRNLANAARAGAFDHGCMLHNEVLGGGEPDPDILEAFRAHVERTKTAFEKALGTALGKGEVPADLDIAATADLLVGFNEAAANLHRVGWTEDRIERFIFAGLRCLEVSPRG